MKQYIHRPGTRAYKSLEREAINRGATKFGVSTKGNSKYFVIYKGKTIHFGSRIYQDYTFHKDEARRERYRNRHRGILKKDGTPAYLDKNQASYWAWNLLWD
jgi:hypothetical protein